MREGTLGVLVATIGALLSSCSWLRSRGDDAADVLTISAERQVGGVHGIVGPAGGLGIFLSPHGPEGLSTAWGLAGGKIGSFEHEDGTLIPLIAFVQRRRSDDGDHRRKDFHVVGSTLWLHGQGDPAGYFGGFEGADDSRRVIPRWGAIEVAIGVWYGLRLGVNIVELADAVVGWIGIDFLADDGSYEPSSRPLAGVQDASPREK